MAQGSLKVPETIHCKEKGVYRPTACTVYSTTEGGPKERFWVGASDYDYQQPWKKQLWICPLLDNVGLAIRKAHQDRFRGTMLIPWWPTRPWWSRLFSTATRVHRLENNRCVTPKRRYTACVHYSDKALCSISTGPSQ